jgi:hypothetical protein
MTDKNQAALDAFDRLTRCLPDDLPYEAGKLMNADLASVRAALQSRTATSAGVDVSSDPDDWIKELRDALKYCDAEWKACNANGRPAQMPIAHFDSLIWGAEKYLQSIPDMREAWLPIESAPRDGTVFLGLSKFYKDPFVTYWGSAAQERGDIPALPEGSSIQQHWVLANSEDGSVLYEPDFWMPLKCSEPPKGEKS